MSFSQLRSHSSSLPRPTSLTAQGTRRSLAPGISSPQRSQDARLKGGEASSLCRANSPVSTATNGAGSDDENSNWPCKKTWCGGERRRHLLLCLTSEKHFGNSYTHICSRPEIWLMPKADPWARDEESGEIVGLEPEPVPPPQRVLEGGYNGLTEEEKLQVDAELLEEDADDDANSTGKDDDDEDENDETLTRC